MNICMVLHNSAFPGDIRVENEATALVEAGHNVFVVCDALPDHNKFEVYKGVKILRISHPAIIYRKINSLLYYLFLRNYYWQRALKNFFDQYHFDVFHVHDLPLTGTVIDLAQRLSIPVVFDSHENYSIGLRSYRTIPVNFFKALWVKYIYNFERWERYEKTSFKKSDKVISVVPEMKERIAQLGIPEEKIVVVSNTVNIEQFASFAVDSEIVAKYENRFVISYVGRLARHRRIDTVIRAMPFILAEIPQAVFVVVGEVDSRPELWPLVQEMGLADSVRLIGWQDLSKIPSYIAASNMGIIPQQPNEHTNNTIPHKLFQYMYMGKPQVVSNCKAIGRIVTETGCGVICNADLDDAQAWAKAITSLKDDELRQEMGQCGRKAILNKYNWSVDKQQLIRLYENME